MSPREKNLALLSAAAGLTLAVFFIPSFVWATLLVAVCCSLCFRQRAAPLPAGLGLHPRAGLTVPAALRWLWGWWVSDVSVGARRGAKSGGGGGACELPEAQGRYRQREFAIYRREALSSESFLFSPRDFLMGSYIGKPESPPADPRRPRVGRNPREQLREGLARPNHAVITPNRRLSFTGDTPGSVGRVSIAPQRHYPLQQAGAASLGVLPPVRWDSFRKKSILSPRNLPAAQSPVTVKIARPEHSSTGLEHLSGSTLPRAPADPRTPVDPCSRESVLKVLKESRKREVEDEERSFTIEQRSKRRRNDSGGSSYSAFEPLLPNGTPSQLVPKPGSLKRGMALVSEESSIKRSRTSSISSGSGGHTPRGTPGSKRNPIHSSYSSTLGISQWKRPSAPSSPLSSPGSSRSHTPDTAAKRPREDDGVSPTSASSVRLDRTAPDAAPVSVKPSHAPKAPVAAASLPSSSSGGGGGGGGKRKRQIQLVSRDADAHISLPPPPELGYTVTAKDLDEEKKEAISKIQKVLETPAPQPEKLAPPPAATLTSTPAASTSSSTSSALSSLLAAPLPTIPVINLDPAPPSAATTTMATTSASTGTVTTTANPLLEALKMKSPAPTAVSVAASSASPSPLQPIVFSLKTSTTTEAAKPTPAAAAPAVSQPQPTPAATEQPSAFTQVLSQQSKPASSGPSVVSLFGLSSQSGGPPAISSAPGPAPSLAPTAPSSSAPLGSTNPLLASGFKPIFSISAGGSSAPENKSAAQNFKPAFGSSTAGAGFGAPPSLGTTAPASSAAAVSAASVFGGSTSSSSAPLPAQTTVKSFYGNWPATTAVSSTPTPTPPTGNTFQFGAAATSATTSTAATTSTFTFGSQPEAAPTGQFAFGQMGAGQTTTTTASFGGFGEATAPKAAAVAPPTAAAPTAAASTQSTFTFGKPAAQPTFGSLAPPPFPFGAGAASSQPASNPAPGPSPFTFGVAAATTAPSFSTPTKPAFGNSGFAFGGTTAPAAPPTFGATTQTQSSSSTAFMFGGSAPQPPPSGPTQPPSTAFNFGASMNVSQFGTPAPTNPAPQMGGFNFGGAAAEKTTFGTSTPSFGQNPASSGGPVPFGSPATPLQGFGAAPFGATGTPSFSIGAGSKPSGARQRLQARRQHNRKK